MAEPKTTGRMDEAKKDVENDVPENISNDTVQEDEKALDSPKEMDGKARNVPGEEDPKSSPANLDNKKSESDIPHIGPTTEVTIEPVPTSTGEQEEYKTERINLETVALDIQEDTGDLIDPIEKAVDEQDGPGNAANNASDLSEEDQVKFNLGNAATEKEAKNEHIDDQQGIAPTTCTDQVASADIAILKEDVKEEEKDEPKHPINRDTAGPLGDNLSQKAGGLPMDDDKTKEIEPNESTPLLTSDQEPILVGIVVGVTGSGKSATANTLLGKKAFNESSSATSDETTIQRETIAFPGLATPIPTKGKYPCLSEERIRDFEGIRATDSQMQKANDKAKEEIEKKLKDYGHSVESMEEISLNYKHLTIVDTPGSWNLKWPASNGKKKGTIYIIVINLSSPRFDGKDLKQLKSLPGEVGKLIVLTHADEGLNGKTLKQYLDEIKGDPLHDLLTAKEYMGNVLAINNSPGSVYERDLQRMSLLAAMARAAKEVSVFADDSERRRGCCPCCLTAIYFCAGLFLSVLRACVRFVCSCFRCSNKK